MLSGKIANKNPLKKINPHTHSLFWMPKLCPHGKDPTFPTLRSDFSDFTEAGARSNDRDRESQPTISRL